MFFHEVIFVLCIDILEINMNIFKPPKYHGKRPKKTKKIGIQYRSYRGHLKTTKKHLIHQRSSPILFYNSSEERKAYIILDHDLFCVEIVSQPVIPWVNE